jgi:hypothetical protein
LFVFPARLRGGFDGGGRAFDDRWVGKLPRERDGLVRELRAGFLGLLRQQHDDIEVADAADFLRRVIDELKTTSRTSSPLRLGEDMIAKTVCRHAVKANDPLRYPEIEKLIRDLLACDLPYCCPHGRPTMIQISHAELEKKFGRKV